jgi:CRISPR type I-E-associated protein CasB/Cse2
MSDQKPDRGAIARDWWQAVSTDRATMAKLRRCHTPVEALLVPQTLTLARKLGLANRPERLNHVGALAVVLAHVKKDDPNTSIMRALGRDPKKPDDPDTAKLSNQRLRRLLLVDGSNALELMSAMTRLVRFMDNSKANVSDLTTATLWWNDRTRQRWAFDYLAAGFACPGAAPTETDETAPALASGDTP